MAEEKKTEKPKKKKKVGKVIAIMLIIMVIAIAIMLGVAYLIFHHYYGKMNIDKGDNIEYVTTEFVDDDVDLELEDSSPEEIQDADELLKQNLEDKSTPILMSDHVYNILLIGNDSRDKNVLGRSDSMIILSINEESKEIIMTSIMRDSYVAIPGHGNNRINAAYAWGGPSLLIETIESNFKIKIDSYVGVNFFTFQDVVDAVGGVDITVSDAEVKVLNRYVQGLNALAGIDLETDKLPGGGTYHMNGKQALGYARIRYVGNADYQRTERQRLVLTEIFKNTKGLSLSELNSLMNKILPNVTTDISEGTMVSLLLNFVTEYKDYQIVSCRVPCTGSIKDLVIKGAMVLGIDIPMNIKYMEEHIYHR